MVFSALDQFRVRIADRASVAQFDDGGRRRPAIASACRRSLGILSAVQHRSAHLGTRLVVLSALVRSSCARAAAAFAAETLTLPEISGSGENSGPKAPKSALGWSGLNRSRTRAICSRRRSRSSGHVRIRFPCPPSLGWRGLASGQSATGGDQGVRVLDSASSRQSVRSQQILRILSA